MAYVWESSLGELIYNAVAAISFSLEDADYRKKIWDAIGKQIDYQSVPIGSIIAWHKNLTGTPSLPANFAEVSGQTISDSDSPYNGVTLPNLNGQARFLRGSSTSGTLQDDAVQYHGHNGKSYYGSGTIDNKFANIDNAATLNTTVTNNQIIDPITLSGHTTLKLAEETRSINMSVVWIIRIK